jgi:hypothetical protein
MAGLPEALTEADAHVESSLAQFWLSGNECINEVG